MWIATFARETSRMFININKKKIYLPWHIRRVALATYWADRARFILPVEPSRFLEPRNPMRKEPPWTFINFLFGFSAKMRCVPRHWFPLVGPGIPVAISLRSCNLRRLSLKYCPVRWSAPAPNGKATSNKQLPAIL